MALEGGNVKKYELTEILVFFEVHYFPAGGGEMSLLRLVLCHLSAESVIDIEVGVAQARY